MGSERVRVITNDSLEAGKGRIASAYKLRFTLEQKFSNVAAAVPQKR
jgi:hypothetical protein